VKGWIRTDYEGGCIRYSQPLIGAFPAVFVRDGRWWCCGESFEGPDDAIRRCVTIAREWVERRRKEIEDVETAIAQIEGENQ